jgi:uncharacterized protein YhfF
MPIPVNIAEYWERFSTAEGGVDPARFYEAFHFGDNEELANSLAGLVLKSTKRATTGSVWSFEHEGKQAPQPGDLSVVTNWASSPLCVIETVQVEIMPFGEVTAEFAAMEGEGDGSLTYWREAHSAYFSRECARNGRVFTENMPVACEQFKVVFVGSPSAA